MKHDPSTGDPNFYQLAREYLHTYLPTTRGCSPKAIEAYRIALECFIGYLTDTEHIDRSQVGFDAAEPRSRTSAGACLARVARLAQDREQNRRRRALESGQNSAPHHPQTTTTPSLPRPGRARLAARPAGDIPIPLLSRAAVATAGSRAATNRAFAEKLRRAFSTIVSRVAEATSPRPRARP